MSLPNCPKCNSQYTYEDMGLYICPECFHEWTQADLDKALEESIIRDAFGNELNDGDDVIIIKDLTSFSKNSPIFYKWEMNCKK